MTHMNIPTLLILSLICASALTHAEDSAVDYNRDIRPILSDNCFVCHGPDEHDRKAKLRLDTYEGAIAVHDGVAAIVPGAPEKSAAVDRITNPDPDEIMPPPKTHKTLTKSEIALLTRWIASGAQYAAAWTYVTPKQHPVPKPADTMKKSANWIDDFILARLEKLELRFSPQADPRTLVRRLSFDLTGLPPTPAVVSAFAAKPTATAYEALVDGYLASSGYGERMAAYWLDLVRFADTVGYHGDQDHQVTPYRDYVINAFNANMPFDQFTREQLAGDLLPNPTLTQKIATCYNRLLQTSHEGGVQEKEYLAIYAADRVRNVSGVWMGATVGCAQCHDHKYDPYTTRDFYRMSAFFADVDETKHFKNGSNSIPTKRDPEIRIGSKAEMETLRALADTHRSLDAAYKKAGEAEKRSAHTLTNAKPATDELKQQVSALMKTAANAKEALGAAANELKNARSALPLCMVTESVTPRITRVLPRGNWLDESGDVVESAIPEFLGSLKTDGRATRLDFANWLVANDGSGLLTARVQVNRYWYLLFGTGITRSLADFGGQGVPPANLELLDNLAVAFVESGWNIKAMMKVMVLSRTYQQSSLSTAEQRDRDPYNQLLAHQSRFRLSAEMVRDNALAVSGLLVHDVGGASVKPYQPTGYYRHLNFPTRSYKQHSDPRQWRRGVYVHWQRQFLHPMLKAFDAPSREECTAERPISNTPTAALVLLNDPTFIEAAKMLAVRIIQAESKREKRMTLAAELTWGRLPIATERHALRALLEKSLASYKASPATAILLAQNGLTPIPKPLNPVDLAGWTAVTRAMLCTSETLTRN